jgi:hypothetical protein
MHREIVRAFLVKSVVCTCFTCGTHAIFTVSGTALSEVNGRNRSYHLSALPLEETVRKKLK